MAIIPLNIIAYTVVNALGDGVEASARALIDEQSGLRPCNFDNVDLDTWIGRVDKLENETLDFRLAAYDCRNNRLAQLALKQDRFAEAVKSASADFGSHRIGVFIGTSTSGILSTEEAYRERQLKNNGSGPLPGSFSFRHTHDVFAPADFVQNYFQLNGPVLGVSTACSSSAKVFVSAYRHIRAGLCDVALVGGVDSLCLTTIYGFNSLELTSHAPCRPWDAARNGISVGEAAGFMLLTAQRWEHGNPVCLLGYGESSDAHHMSAADPQGRGARLAMSQALERAGLAPEDIDYINLHGTATPSNDTAEDHAVVSLFSAADTPCSSTKGWSGHTLGAAGIVEAVFSCLCIKHDILPGCLNTEQLDPSLNANIQLRTQRRKISRVMSNSFGFAGSNCSLIFGDKPA